ncbi:hypothetical protein HWV62_45346 [Athelia sp. TMB]|nr:hypothetical protein HWV62_33629 [Athelia sp. TMB]KAF7978609.1 hypothetical protein HWV62_45346 [Athelia sp. TMB]
MVYISAKFITLAALFVSTSALTIGKRDVAALQSQIATISTDITNLDTAIDAYPNSGGSLSAGLAINTLATTLVTALNTGTTDAQAIAGPVDEADGEAIIASIQAVVPTIEDALTNIVLKKPSFTALIVGDALVLQDLQKLNASTVAFENSLVAIAPADLQSKATAIIASLATAFATAIAAYN